MNIFILDEDPVLAAQYQADKHVVKMVLETAQILCTVREKENPPYRPTHKNHPCVKWARESFDNYSWLLKHLRALLDEYTFRYNKKHKTEAVYAWLSSEKEIDAGELPQIGLTPFAQAMPEEYRQSSDAVQAYRRYYIKDKYKIAEWNKARPKPDWFN